MPSAVSFLYLTLPEEYYYPLAGNILFLNYTSEVLIMLPLVKLVKSYFPDNTCFTVLKSPANDAVACQRDILPYMSVV